MCKCHYPEGITFKPDGGVRMQATDGPNEPTLEQLQTLVDGYIEAVPARHGVMIVNDEANISRRAGGE